MRVAAGQFKARKENRSESLDALRSLAEQAAAGSDLVVLPEMAATGYVFSGPAEVRAVAELPTGPTYQALAPVAKAHRCWIVSGFPELAADRLFNSALVIDPAGALAFTYRKTLLYEADVPWAAPGDSGYRRFDSDAGSFGVGICMDLNDDRFTSWCAAADLAAVALPTNWIDEDEIVWPYWALRMFWTPAALVAANTWGAEGDLRFSGASAVVQRGRLLASAAKVGDGVVRAKL